MNCNVTSKGCFKKLCSLFFAFFLFVHTNSYAQVSYVYANQLLGNNSHVAAPGNAVSVSTTDYSTLESYGGIAINLGSYTGRIELGFPSTVPAGTTCYVRIQTDATLLNTLLGGGLGNALANLTGTIALGNHYFQVRAKETGNATPVFTASSVNGFANENARLVYGTNGYYYIAITPSVAYNSIEIEDYTNTMLLGTINTLRVYNAFYFSGNDSCSPAFATSFDGTGGTVDILGVGGAGVANPNLAIDNSNTTFSQVSMGALTVAGTISQTTYFATPSDATDEFHLVLQLDDPSILNLGVADGIKIEALNGTSVVYSTGLGSLLNLEILGLLSSGQKTDVAFKPSLAFDRVKVTISSLVQLNLVKTVKIFDVYRSPAKPTVTTASITINSGQSVTLAATTTAANELVWFNSLTGSAIATTAYNQTHMVSNVTASTIFYVATRQIGCSRLSERVPIAVTINPLPVASDITISANINTSCAGVAVLAPTTALTGGVFKYYTDQSKTQEITTGFSGHTGIIYSKNTTTGALTISGLNASNTPRNYYISVYVAGLGENAVNTLVAVQVGAPPVISANVVKTNVSANGGTNGSATVTATGGTSPYTYLWSPSGGTAATAAGLSEGTYTVAITDANLCTVTKSIYVDGPPAVPGGLIVTAGNGQNVLGWTASTEADLASYKIYWGISANPTTLLTTVTAPAITYTHTAIANGTTYYYRIKAVDQEGNESAYGTEVTATPKVPQTITFNAIATKTYGDTDFDAGAITTSGLTISYSSDNSSVATIVAGKVHIVGAGIANITASQLGGLGYAPAVDQVQVLTVGKKALTVTATVNNKVYDGNANADASLNDNRVSGDVLNLSFSSAAFDNKNAGNNKQVSVSGINVSGTSVANYTFNTTASSTANITPKALTITATATDKVYDGNANATVSLNDDRLTGDALSLTNTTATFSNKNVGANKSISITGISTSGTDAGNYTFNSTATAAANITTKTLTINATANNKVYDGNANATVSLNDNRLTGDVLSLANTAAMFDSKNVGTNKPVSITGISISGTDAVNYTFNTTATASANITAKALVVAATGNNKAYDGNATATVSLSDNRVSGDILSLTNTAATFNNKNVGLNKTVSVTGIGISGTDAGNYTFNTMASAAADITAKALMITATASDKVYDGNANAMVSLNDDRLMGDVLNVTNTAATFNNKNVGVNKTVSVTGIGISGTDAVNYTFNTMASGTANITAKALVITATTNNKVYDGNANATVSLSDNRVTGDVLTVINTTTTFDNKNVGTNKAVNVSGISISGTDVGNYTFNTTATSVANITPKTLAIMATASDKVYDGNANATVSLSDNRLSGDVLILTNTAAMFDNKNVGSNKPVNVTGISTGGTDAGNYTYNTSALATANIAMGKLSYVAATTSKVYGDANPSLSGTITGFVGTDTQTTATSGTLNFSTMANNTSGIGTYAINGSGLTAQNYTFDQAGGNVTALTITARPVTILADAKSKTYGDNDPVLTYQVTSGNLVNGDTFTGTLVRDAGQNAGSYAIGKGTVSLSNNYNLTYQSANLLINKTLLTVTANNSARCYSVSNPIFGLSYSGFKYTDNENSLTTKPTVSTIANVGSAAGNYDLVPLGGVSANYDFSYTKGTLTINPLPVNVIVSSKGTSISKGETTVLTVNSNNGTTYSWASANGMVSGQNTAALTVRPMQTTTYTVTVRNAAGCESIAAITIEVQDDYIVQAENFITPNGDGVNDTWVVKNIDAYPNHTLSIYDRSGKELYKVRNYKNDWDGNFNGMPLTGGTYYYIIRFDQNPRVVKGFITVVRNSK